MLKTKTTTSFKKKEPKYRKSTRRTQNTKKRTKFENQDIISTNYDKYLKTEIKTMQFETKF